MQNYKERWLKLFHSGTDETICLNAYHGLITRYSEKHRAYHNFNHIIAALEHFDLIKEKLEHPISVELALWYHDAIYNTLSGKNEEKSADLAVAELSKMNVPGAVIAEVRELILVTKHPSIPRNNDEKYMVDIDLVILGAEPAIFQEYEQNVRKEYKWVPKFLYKTQRKKVLESFINQDRIYHTEYFHEKFEQKARENIRKLLG